MVLTDYSTEYDEEIKKLDPEIYRQIKSHKDVIPDSVCIALHNGVFSGVGLLLGTPSFMNETRTSNEVTDDEEDVPHEGSKKEKEYYLNGEFKSVPGSENEVGTAYYILKDLKQSFKMLQTDNKDKKLVLRLFCNGTDLAYMEFLMVNEFAAAGVMPVFSKDLSNLKSKRIGTCLEGTTVVSLKKKPELYKEYLKSYKAAFNEAESTNALSYVLKSEKNEVFCLERNGKVIAAASVSFQADERAVLENVFCSKRYRNKGIASWLLAYLTDYLKNKNFMKCDVLVEGNNYPAVKFYFKNGFEVSGSSIVMKYSL